jgi:Fe2+ transport system protein B
LKLALCYISSLVVYDIFADLFFFIQKAGDCDFFEWADKEMSAYEKRLAQHLKEMKERRQADNDKVEELIKKKCKEQLAHHLKEMEERVEELIEKNCKEQLAQHGKMFGVSLLVVILVLAFYFSSYSEPRHTNLMLK